MLVTAGKEPLFVVEDLSRIRVQLNVPQTYAMQTEPGVRGDDQPARVASAAGRGGDHAGRRVGRCHQPHDARGDRARQCQRITSSRAATPR